MNYTVKPEKVCPKSIDFELNENIVSKIVFGGGCNGNLKAISILLEGKTVEEIEDMLLGNTCGKNITSCTDQLARLVRQKYDENKAI